MKQAAQIFSHTMSIAVSAVVKPSRLLIAFIGTCCMGVAAIGIAIAARSVGELSFGLRMTLGTSCFFLAFFGAYRTLRSIKAHHIDISGNGLIRLMETSPMTDAPLSSIHRDGRSAGEPVILRPDSTLWPFLMLLNLEAENRSFSVPVLPDSVDRDSFKALLGACRWIAARPDSKQKVNF